jgi:hypothetical protein
MSTFDTIYAKRQYLVTSVEDAKSIAKNHLKINELGDVFSFGLPEVDDRYHVWRVPLTLYSRKAGEIVINAKTAAIDLDKSSNIEFLIRKTVEENNKEPKKRNTAKKIELSDLKILF